MMKLTTHDYKEFAGQVPACLLTRVDRPLLLQTAPVASTHSQSRASLERHATASPTL